MTTSGTAVARRARTGARAVDHISLDLSSSSASARAADVGLGFGFVGLDGPLKSIKLVWQSDRDQCAANGGGSDWLGKAIYISYVAMSAS